MAGFCAPHPWLQICLGRDALFYIEHVDGLVGLLEQVGQVPLQGVYHRLQIRAGQTRQPPLLYQQATDNLGSQDVAAVQLLVFQRLCALSQCIELRADLLGDRERHARGENFVLHHIVAQQLELHVPRKGGAMAVVRLADRG